jgi:hypothetical protein
MEHRLGSEPDATATRLAPGPAAVRLLKSSLRSQQLPTVLAFSGIGPPKTTELHDM